ncbi:MAG: redoxin domain-containing protein, partial [Flavobacteriales bacterium]
MKKALLALSIAALPCLATAQTNNYPNGSTVADFTVTDIDGQEHNLNAYAAAGKYVLLDFFFYNCGWCQVYAPYYSELYQTYGCNGGDLVCISINNGDDTDVLAGSFHEDFAPGYAHSPTVG